jgi:HD-GYP domain-containing protein (c-di-GMP phosphodiesterase class II)
MPLFPGMAGGAAYHAGMDATARLIARIERLNAIGVALSAEQDQGRLLETILLGAKELTGAEGGSIYRVESDFLHFEIVRNDALGVAYGGTSGRAVPFKPLPLKRSGGPVRSVVAYAVICGTTVNIPDAYHAEGFDFSGTRAFDAQTGYHSTSFLTVPMRDHEGEITGVLQLINARDAQGVVTAFSDADQRLVESLASQAATAQTKKALIDGMARLFEAFIELIATAIDEKSPYTGGHCRRVPELTMLLAEAAAATESGPLADFRMSEADRYELRIAGWLHDCGKITTPEWVMDKATKLQCIHDRIEEVAARMASIRRGDDLRHAQGLIDVDERDRRRGELAADLAFLRRCNIGGESMRPEDQDRVRAIATRTWTDVEGQERPLLELDEVENLVIPKGTLLPREREVINHHMVATLKMLERLPFPKHLQRVPEYAGGHHERMDGKGYPKGLRGDQMSVPARVMAIADVFEALTAGDRPYKKAMPLSQALGILGRMAETGHIDPDLFDVFIRSRVYERYAERFLGADQRDVIDLDRIPGYRH